MKSSFILLLRTVIISGLVLGSLSHPSKIMAALTINRHNNFISWTNLQPNQTPLSINALKWLGVTFLGDEAPGQSLLPELNNATPRITTKPLVYPNPFRYGSGAHLGFRLNRADLFVDLKVYDMRGNQIFSNTIAPGDQGARFGYNRFPINADTLSQKHLPSGVYFFLILNNGDVLGKGKFVVMP
jgi:hypothetical protein